MSIGNRFVPVFFACVCACLLSLFCTIGYASAENYNVTYSCGDYATGTASYGTATTGASFVPAQNTCIPSQSSASFTGWAVSGTTDIIDPNDGPFPWNYEENKTFTATWSCWPNEDGTDCVPGYEIILTWRPSAGEWYIPPVPDKLYTIYGVGAYLDAGRTKNMESFGGQYRIIPPEKRSFEVTLNTNGPYNPTALPAQVRRATSPNSFEPITMQRNLADFEYGPSSPGTSYGGAQYYHRINSSGYLTAVGKNFAKNEPGGTWYANWSPYPSMLTPTLTGYTFKGWYDNPAGTGDQIIYNTDAYLESPDATYNLYAKWEANKYSISYDLGDFGQFGNVAVRPNEATYDIPFEVSHPEPNDANKYKFAGWEVTNMTEGGAVVHYYSDIPIIINNEYQSGTSTIQGVRITNTFAKHFMNLRSMSGAVQFKAQYDCVDGYGWNSNNTECVKTYGITYVMQNAPNGVSAPSGESVVPGLHTLQDVPTVSGHYVCSNWACSYDDNGTSVDVPVDSNNGITMPAADISCVSTCDCDNANNYWWNVDNSACVQGYTITLSVNSQLPEPDSDPDPTTLYTIPTRGAYLDAQRTLLMTESEHPITPPQRFFTTEYDTNAPDNPITNEPYNISEVEDQDYHYNYKCFLKVDNECRITANTGYITNQGIADAQNIYENQHWFVSAGGTSTSYPRSKPILTGYNCDGWYTSADDSGSLVTYFSSDIHPSLLYAHWTPKTYNVVYNKGAHATSGSSNYTDTNGATYDSQYVPLSFNSAPVSNNMSADTGYVFVGWTTDTPANQTITNGVLNNQYTGDTYWKSTSALTLYAAYDCADGFHWEQDVCVPTPKIVNLLWNFENGDLYNGNQNSCTYETGEITSVSHQEIPGWTFTGWKVTNWWHRLLDTLVDSVSSWCYYFRVSATVGGYYAGYNGLCGQLRNLPNNDNTWGLAINNNGVAEKIIGIAKCRDQSTTLYNTGDPGTDNGQYCWCQIISYTSPQGITENYTDLPWVYAYDYSTDTGCNAAGHCLEKCATTLRTNNTTFRTALFGLTQ